MNYQKYRKKKHHPKYRIHKTRKITKELRSLSNIFFSEQQISHLFDIVY